MPIEKIAEEIDIRIEQLKGFPNSQRLWLELYVFCMSAVPHLKPVSRTRFGTEVRGVINNVYRLVKRTRLFSRTLTLSRFDAFSEEDNTASFSVFSMNRTWRGLNYFTGQRSVKGHPGNDPRDVYLDFE